MASVITPDPANNTVPLFERGMTLLAVLALLLASYAVISNPFPPLQDLPEWTYQGWMLKEWWLGNPTVHQLVMLAPYPVPNSLVQIILAVGCWLFTPALAAKLTTVMYLLFAMVSIVVFSRKLSPALRGSFQLLMVMLIALGQRFWNGYLAYQLGLLLLCWFLYALMTVNPRRMTRIHYVLLAAAGVLIFFCHAIIYFAFLASVAVLVLSTRQPRLVLMTLPSLSLALWHTAAVAAAESHAALFFPSWRQAVLYKLYTVGKFGPFVNFYYTWHESALQQHPVLYGLGVALNIIVATCFIAAMLWSMLRQRGAILQQWPAVTCPALGFLLLFLLLPLSHALGVVNIGERLLGITFATGCMSLLVIPHHRQLVNVIRILAALTAISLPYLLIPAAGIPVITETPSTDIQSWIANYYTEQRYYNTRPNNSTKLPLLLDTSALGKEVPAPFFSTSVLLPKHSLVEPAQPDHE